MQRYFSEMASSPRAQESKDKIRDVLSSVLASAVDFGLIVKNPVEAQGCRHSGAAKAEQSVC